MLNLGYNIIRVLLLLLESGILSENFRPLQVRSPDHVKGNGFFALDFIGLVEQHGRNAEWHNVTTADGYILSVFRIPPNPSSSNKKNRNRVILLQHGIVGTADCFVIMDSTQSLAYLLSDAGYDVWLGNLRGNTYSRRHKTLSTDDPKFWDFSIDEYALLDLPAMIDYVIQTTKQSRITYMGHSLGTTIILMLLSEQKKYNDKLDCVVLLAPVVYWNRDTPSAAFVLPARLGKILSPAGKFEVLPRNNLVTFVWKHFCPINKFTMEICTSPTDLIFGKAREKISPEMMLKFVTYYLGGASAKVFYHSLQYFDYGEFSRYDYYDDEENLRHYGQITAPLYNLGNIKTPIIVVHSLNDPLSRDAEVEYLLNQFSNDTKVIYSVIRDKKFNHLDFMIGKNAKIVYDQLIKIMSQFHADD